MTPPTQRVLITGGGGFIGSHLVPHFVAEGHEVRATIHNRPPTIAFHRDVRWMPLDLTNERGIIEACAGCEVVIHAAAILSDTSRKDSSHIERANVEMTRNVIRACEKQSVRRVVYVSTTAALGIPSDPTVPADESSRSDVARLRPGYQLSKRRCEDLVIAANGSQMETVVVNPGFVFGQHGSRYRGGEVIDRVLRRWLVICTAGGLSMVHVDDVVAGIVSAANRGEPGERYILSGENHTFTAIAEIVCRVAGVRRLVVTLPEVVRVALGVMQNTISRLNGREPALSLSRKSAYHFYSSDKARQALDYKPRSFEAIVVNYLAALAHAVPSTSR